MRVRVRLGVMSSALRMRSLMRTAIGARSPPASSSRCDQSESVTLPECEGKAERVDLARDEPPVRKLPAASSASMEELAEEVDA